MDISAIRFSDPVRERARQSRLARERETGVAKKRAREEEKKAERARRKAAAEQRARERGDDPNKRKKGRNRRLREEWDELAKEERLHKKLKRGKITEQEYKRLMYGDDEDEDNGGGGGDKRKELEKSRGKRKFGTDFVSSYLLQEENS